VSAFRRTVAVRVKQDVSYEITVRLKPDTTYRIISQKRYRAANWNWRGFDTRVGCMNVAAGLPTTRP